MKNFSLLILVSTLPFLLVAQSYGDPIIFDSGECGESLFKINDESYVLNIRSENTLSQEFLLINEDCCGFDISNSQTYFDGSSAYCLFTENAGSNSSTSRLYTTGGIGDSPQNTDIFVTARNTDNTQIWSTQLPLPSYDAGLKTIGTSDGGALTVAVVEDAASGLEQLRILKHEPIAGAATWETYIPIADTGYDIIFQGQVAGEFVYETQPTPPISIVEEVPDGYIIVNPNKEYSPPTSNKQYANIIKLDLAGNLLWTNNVQIPWRELEIGSGSSLDIGFRGRVTSVEGTADGSTYFSFSSSSDINPNAQYRKLDNTGAIVETFSTSWTFNDNFSWLIKEINGQVYWVKLSEVFTDNSGPPTNVFDFAIFNITNGIDFVGAANNPTAFLPETPEGTYIPKDLEQLANGDFLVTGAYYDGVSFADQLFNNPPSQAFIVRLENQDLTSAGADLNLSVSASNENVGAYEYVELTYSITNEGDAPATGIVSKIERTSTAVLASEVPVVASQGSFGSGFAETAFWEIGDLAPGQTETLNLTYFTLATSTVFSGEVSEMNEADSDSTPNNGIFGEAQEDDEASIAIGEQAGIIRGTVFLDENRDGGENCATDDCTFISGIEIKLYIQGTNTLLGTAVSQANGSYIFPNVPAGAYTLEYEYQNNYVPTPYFNGPFNFELTNNFLDIAGETPYIGVGINSNNPEGVFNLGLVDGTECTLDELFVETSCNDNGTPNNPNDDTFNVNFRADGQGRASYSLNGSGGTLWNNSLTYSDSFENIGPFDLSELPVTLTLNNLGNLPTTNCSLSETITSVDCGSTGGTQPDLTITPTGTIPASVQPGENYPSAANITNAGGDISNSPTNFNNALFLSTDAFFDASDISLSIVGLNSFAANESTPFLNIFVPDNAELGDYYILYVVDYTNVIDESNENNNVLARPVTIGPIGTGDVDLELSASTDIPAIYQNGEAVFTLTNTGTQAATNIEILFAKNSSLNIAGVPMTSQGTTDLHWTDAPEWSVGTLAAGQSATITFNIFSLSETPTLYGQVAFQSETDVDSTPDNGNGLSPNEDDEALYPGTGTVDCEISIADFNQPTCNNNGTPNPNDDTFSFSITPTVNSPGGFYLVNVPEIIQDYNVIYNPIVLESGTTLQQSFTINDAQLAFGNSIEYIIYYPDFSCEESIEVIIPEPCSEEEGFAVTCATNITPPLPVQVDPNDDYSGRVVTWDPPTATTDCPSGVTIEQISGPPSGSFFNVWTSYPIVYDITDECGNSETCIFEIFVNGITGTLICPDDITVDATSTAGAVVTFGNAIPVTSCNASPVGPSSGEPQSGDLFPIGTTEVEFSTFFTGSAAFCQNFEICTTTITVLPEGGGNDGVDLELTASSDAPSIWQSGTAIFTLTNNGNETATGIELEFNKNSSLNITGTPTASQGTPQLHWTDTPRWNVGSLAAGQSATITFDVFAISENINFYGQVTAQNEADADSAPNNGNGISLNEDDEVSYPGGDIIVPCQLTITQTEYFCDDQGTSDPSDDTWTQTYVIDNNNPNATGYNIYPGGGSGTYPATLSFGGLVIAAGMNTNMYLIRDIDDFECSGTLGVFPPPGCGEEQTEDLPDLTLSNLNADNGIAGEISEYTVQVNNIGMADVSGDYVIGVYLSTDNQLSAGDTQVGVINTGNTPVGSEPLTTGAITVPAGQTPGNYFLILETDTEEEIVESNETNNVVFVPILISDNTSTCDLNVELISIHCDQSTGLGGVVNDEFFYYLMATGGDDLTGWYLDPGPFTNYEFEFSTLFTANISDGPQTFTARASNDANCTSQITIVPPAPCNDTGCNLNVFTNDISCSGDNYSMELFVTGNLNQGNQYTAIFPNADGSGGTYQVTGSTISGTQPTITYDASDVINNLGGIINYTVFRTGNPDCSIEGQLFMPSTCSPGAGDGIDLSLDIIAPATINQYQNFTAEYVITNNGTTTATNISAEILTAFNNSGIVFQGGNEATVSQGEFDGEFDTEWIVGDIPAGGSATLTANLFSLASSTNILWGEILTHNQTDVDSTPNNGVYGEENEDDEAEHTLSVINNLQGGGTTSSMGQINELSAQLYPIPTRDNLTVNVFMENSIETQLSIKNTNGQEMIRKALAAQKGVQSIQLSTSNWPNGVYFLQLFNGEEMKTYRFVKQ